MNFFNGRDVNSPETLDLTSRKVITERRRIARQTIPEDSQHIHELLAVLHCLYRQGRLLLQSSHQIES